MVNEANQSRLIACALYYWVWIHFLPYLRGYTIREEVVTLDDGSRSHQLIKVPNGELAEWDEHHDHAGRVISGHRPENKALDSPSDKEAERKLVKE